MGKKIKVPTSGGIVQVLHCAGFDTQFVRFESQAVLDEMRSNSFAKLLQVMGKPEGTPISVSGHCWNGMPCSFYCHRRGVEYCDDNVIEWELH